MFNDPKMDNTENYVSNSWLDDDIKKEEIGQGSGEFSWENNLSLYNVDPLDQSTASCKIEIKEEILTVPSSEEKCKKSDGSDETDDDKKHECKLCSFKTTKKRYLMSHIAQTHAGETNQKLHECEMCDYVTNKPYELKTHSRTHLELWRSSLAKHVRKHSLPREHQKYRCYKCEFTSSSRGNLIAHESEHKKPSEPYKCEVCPYETVHRGNFKFHRDTHRKRVKEKTLKCEFCPYKTHSKRYFQIHLSSHADVSQREVYECDTCGEKFTSRDKFRLHVQHTDPGRVEVFKCHSCKFETRYKPSLKHHLCKHKLNYGKSVAKDDTESSDVLNVEKKSMVKAILQQLIK